MKKLFWLILLLLCFTVSAGGQFGQKYLVGQQTFGQRYGIDPTGLVLHLDQSDPRSGELLSLNFDGAADYVTVNDHASISNTSAVSVAAWVNPSVAIDGTDIDKIYRIVDKATTTAGYTLYIDRGIITAVTDGALAFYIANGTGTELLAGTKTSWAANTWYHVVGVFDPSNEIVLYINGVQDNQVATAEASIGDGIADLHIGVDIAKAANNSWPGQIRTVQIYGIALTAADVMYLAGNPTANETDIIANTTVSAGDMVLFHNYANESLLGLTSNNNDGTHSGTPSYGSSDWYDLSGNGNHGSQATAGSQPTITGADGLAGSARQFDGTADNIGMTAGVLSAALNGSQGVSVSLWFNLDTLDAVDQQLVVVYLQTNGGDSTGARIAVKATTDLLTCGGRSVTGEAFEAKDGSALSVNTWYHAVAVFDYSNDTIALYLNGALDGAVASVTFNNDSWTDSGTHDEADRIGADITGIFFDGFIDIVQIFSRTLTAAEVQRLYLADVQRHGGL